MNITDLADDILGLIELEVKKKRRHQMIKKELVPKVGEVQRYQYSYDLPWETLIDIDGQTNHLQTYLDEHGNCFSELRYDADDNRDWATITEEIRSALGAGNLEVRYGSAQQWHADLSRY